MEICPMNPARAENRSLGRNVHSHAWTVGAAGLIVGLALLVYVPSLHAVSRSILLFAGFHLIGGLIVLASAYSLFLRNAVRRLTRRAGSPCWLAVIRRGRQTGVP